MARNGLGEHMLKGDLNGTRHKVIGGNPEYTERFLRKSELENLEGKIPNPQERTIFSYKGYPYKININGEVIGINGMIMKPFFAKNKLGPRVRIKKVDKDGNVHDAEISILKRMGIKFGPYFKGYSLKKKNSRKYDLRPIDGDFNNMRYDNLHYINKADIRKTKKDLIKFFLSKNPEYPEEQLIDRFDTKSKYIQEIKQEMAEEGKLPGFIDYQKTQKDIGIEFSHELNSIYKLLLQKGGAISNMEVVKSLYPKELAQAKSNKLLATTEEEKEQAQKEIEALTNKVVRVRRKMTDKGLFERFNKNFESKREQAVDMIKNKEISGYTNKQIAEILGLKKEQIDNLSRQVKKQK